MTKTPRNSPPNKGDEAAALEKKRRELHNEKALLAAMRQSSSMGAELRFTSGELYEAALARHLARGGNVEDEITTEEYKETIEGLLAAEEAKREWQGDIDSRQLYAKHLATLKPLLKSRELDAGRISFGRAVLITTGNHTRKDQRPNRWIPIFIRRHEEAAKAITLELVGPGKAWLVDSVSHESKYRRLQAGDYLSLEDFAEMHYLTFLWFEQGIATMEALLAAENSSKKSLVAPGGQPDKPPRRKAKKSRTKSA